MTASKHPHAGTADSVPPLPDDLRSDPGVNDSKGNFARSDANPALIKGENTTEGDVMNDTTASGPILTLGSQASGESDHQRLASGPNLTDSSV